MIKERLLAVKSTAAKVLTTADKFLADVLDMPQPYEIAVLNLMHKPKCSRSTLPVRVEQEEYINLSGRIWGIGIHPVPIMQTYIECIECHATKKYSG